MGRYRKFALAIVVIALVGNLGSSTTSLAKRSSRNCSRAHAVSEFKGFLRSYRHGDFLASDKAIAKEPRFQWYSVSKSPGRRTGKEAYARDTVLRYFLRRQSLQHERLRLLSVKTSKARAWHGGFDFSFRLRRIADDLPSKGRLHHGKAAVRCKIIVWSM